MNIKEQSLQEALRATACQELPKAFVENGEEFWIKAIALVRKRNGTQSYCLVEHRPDGMVVYKKDFGLPSPIFGLISVHPYLMLDMESYMPKGGWYGVSEDMLRFYGIEDRTFFNEFSEEQKQEWKMRYAIDLQMEEDRRKQENGIYPEEEPETPAEETEQTSMRLSADQAVSDTGDVEDVVEVKSSGTLARVEDDSQQRAMEAVREMSRQIRGKKVGRPRKNP